MFCKEAGKEAEHVFTGTYRAATVTERQSKGLFLAFCQTIRSLCRSLYAQRNIDHRISVQTNSATAQMRYSVPPRLWSAAEANTLPSIL